ncbi:MAG: hypothetical protein H0W65_10970 [Sphingomonas sp.]|uniref:PmeII family type II restriction endonuclease n=1 Tax=Sphingomonas sp. TaxID=28214 RepID=UPI0017A6DD8F|nr:PmeII family type II restriction endonuclease [Sphingomonas sp.]MBA3668223.1 hypothetical protein [Sphingomonas sp.]
MPEGGDEAEIEYAPPIPLADAERPRRFRRNQLQEEMPEDFQSQLTEETYQFLCRRFQKLAVDFNDIAKTNFNPFLLLITAPVYNIFSPYEVAERLQLGKAYHGDDTAFGKLAEDKFLKIMGARSPPEKLAAKAAKDAVGKDRWSPIDLDIEVEGQRYLMSIKAGPWTMNQSHAAEMIRHFQELHDVTGARLVIGITYGRYRRLNNKPALVDRELGRPDWFDFLVGKDLWEFVSGVKDVHRHMYQAIRDGQKRFAREHADRTFYEHLKANALSISQSLRAQFDIENEDDFWGTLFNAAFESHAGLPGEPVHVPPLADVEGLKAD